MGNEESSLNNRPLVYKYLERNRDTLTLIAIFGAFSGFAISLYLNPDYRHTALLYALVSAFLVVVVLTAIACVDGWTMINTDIQSIKDLVDKTAIASIVIFLYATVFLLGEFLIIKFSQEVYDSLAVGFLIFVFCGTGLVSLITSKHINTVGKGITGITASVVLFVGVIYMPKYVLIPMGSALLLWFLALSLIIMAIIYIGYKTVKIWRT